MARKMTLKATIDEALMEMEREAQERESYAKYYCEECPYDVTFMGAHDCEECQQLYDEELEYRTSVESGIQNYRSSSPSVILLFATIDEDESYACITQTQLIGAFTTTEEVERAKEIAENRILATYRPFSKKNKVTVTFEEREVTLGNLATGTDAIVAAACYIEG